MNFGSWNMSNIKNESVVISIALYSEKIAENDRKIEQLSKNIKRDMNKHIKLVFDDITIILHNKFLQSDVYIWLASPHIFGFLSIPFRKNLHFIHKNSHRIISDSCDYFAFP